MNTLKTLDTHQLSKKTLFSNQKMFYSVKGVILRNFGNLKSYVLQSYGKNKSFQNSDDCDNLGDCERNCDKCMVYYVALHLNILGVYEFEGNEYLLPIDQAFSYNGYRKHIKGSRFDELYPLCSETIGLAQEKPMIENEKEAILDFAEEVLVYMCEKSTNENLSDDDFRLIVTTAEHLASYRYSPIIERFADMYGLAYLKNYRHETTDIF